MDVNERYVVTTGLTDGEIYDRLAERDTGVLSLADGGQAYAVPISFVVGGDGTVYLRLSDDGDSEKFAYLAETEVASLLVYDEGTGEEFRPESWSVMFRGRLVEVEREAVPGEFDAFRVFDEDIEEVSLRFFRFEADGRTGRAAG